jgi:hypothetical protein
MNRILIGNVDCEAQVGEPERRTLAENVASSIVAHRLVWLAGPGDLLLMPYPMGRDFKHYTLRLMGVDPTSVGEVNTCRVGDDVVVLTEVVIGSPDTVGRLRELMGGRPFRVLPYFHERGVARLEQQLGIATERTAFFLDGGAERLNSKVYFRRLAEEIDIPVAPGTVVHSPRSLAHAISRFLPQTGSVIVKQDMNAGGDGNRVVTVIPERRHFLGATETVHLNAGGDVPDLAQVWWDRMTGERNRQLVVEVYHDTSVVVYSELDVGEGGAVALLSHGEMRMQPLWNGFEIPCQTLRNRNLADFVRCSERLARASGELGFAGKMNCDAAVTTGGEVFFTEINGRLGGCTHIHVVAERLLGEGYMGRHCLLTKNHVPTRFSFTGLLERLDRAGLHFDAAARRGVVILTEDTGRTGTVEYLVIGNTYAEALEDERCLLATL